MSYDHDGGQIFSPDPSETTLAGEDGEISRGVKGLKSPTRWNMCVRRCPGLRNTPNPPAVRFRPFLLVSTQRGDLRVATLISRLRCFAAFLSH